MLSAYSAQCLSVLLRLLPDLAEWLTIKDDAFEITMTSPAGWDFWVSSAEEELTVGFAEYHTHFGWHEATNPDQDAADAAAFIEKLRTGQLLLAVWYQDSEYCGSCPIDSDEDQRAGTWLQRWWRRNKTLQIKAWA